MSRHTSKEGFDPTKNRGVDLELIFNAVHSSHLGDGRPEYAQQGLIWAQSVHEDPMDPESAVVAADVFLDSGTAGIPIGRFDFATGKFTLDATAREIFGTAAYKDTGTAEGDVVEVQADGKLPALDASNLTNVPAPVTGTSVVGLPTPKQGTSAFQSGGVILGDGSLAVWGNQSHGQLGIGDAAAHDRSMPVVPAFPYDFAGVPVKWLRSNYSNLLLTDLGEVWAWGRNASGELGHGDTAVHTLPRKVAALDGINIVDVDMGFHQASSEIHAMFLADTGALYVCGDNGRGQLGLGDTTNRSVPEPLAKSDWTAAWAIGAGLGSSYGIDAAGDLYCWGFNGLGALGLGDVADRNVPTRNNLMGGERIAAFSSDHGDHPTTGVQYYSHCIALTESGRIYTWGYNGSGSLGVGDTNVRDTPQEIVALGTDNKAVYTGGGGAYAFTIVQKNDDTLWGAGRNTEGQLGLGVTASFSDFTEIPNSARVGIATRQVLLFGSYNYCGLAVLYDDGEIRVTGYNADGALGVGSFDEIDTLQPMSFPTRLGAVEICAVGQNAIRGMGIRTSDGAYYQTGGASGSMLPSDAQGDEQISVPLRVRL